MHTKSSVSDTIPVIKEDIELMSRPWSSANCIKSIQHQMEEREQKKERRLQKQKLFSQLKNKVASSKSSGRQTIVVIAVIIAFIMAMVGAITTEEGNLDFICFFLVLLFGGALGASLSLLGTQRITTLPIFTASVVGGGVGIIVGVLQIAPNQSNIFTLNGALQVDIGLVFSSAVFALLGGLAFESTLRNLIAKGRNNANDIISSQSED